ncbi:MAG: HemY protein [Alteromonadaceae bacterium]|jgi:HemY protein
MKLFIMLVFFAFIFCLAIFGGSYLFEEEGYVLLGYGKYYIEATLIGLLFTLFVLWVALKVVAYLFRRLFKLKGATYTFFYGQATHKANEAMKQGFTAFLQQDWSRAEKLLMEAGDKGELKGSRQLYAAVAADAMGDNDKAFAHLAALDTTDVDSTLIKVRLLLKQNALEEATAILEPLYAKSAKNDGVFSSYIQLLRAKQDWMGLLSLLPQIEKREILSELQQRDFAALVLSEALTQAVVTDSLTAAQVMYKGLPRKIKKRTDAICAYIDLLAKHGDVDQAETLLLKTLKKAPIADYLKLFRLPGFAHSSPLNTYVQGQLKQDSENPQMLLALGYLAIAAQDYSLATKALVKVAQSEPELVEQKLLADVLARSGEHQAAIEIYQQLQR